MSGDAAEAAGGDAAQRTKAGNNRVQMPNTSNRIQVSNTKKPLFFYVNLAKRYMQHHDEVELSALGMAIATVVTVAEILKNNGFAVETKIRTSTVEIKDEMRGRPIQKAKIEIVLGKSNKFDEFDGRCSRRGNSRRRLGADLEVTEASWLSFNFVRFLLGSVRGCNVFRLLN